MSTLDENTNGLQQILNTVNELPSGGGPSDYARILTLDLAHIEQTAVEKGYETVYDYTNDPLKDTINTINDYDMARVTLRFTWDGGRVDETYLMPLHRYTQTIDGEVSTGIYATHGDIIIEFALGENIIFIDTYAN